MENVKVKTNKFYVIEEAVTIGVTIPMAGMELYQGSRQEVELDRWLGMFDVTEFDTMDEANEYLNKNYKKASIKEIAPFIKEENGREYKVSLERVGSVVVQGSHMTTHYKAWGFEDANPVKKVELETVRIVKRSVVGSYLKSVEMVDGTSTYRYQNGRINRTILTASGNSRDYSYSRIVRRPNAEKLPPRSIQGIVEAMHDVYEQLEMGHTAIVKVAR